MSVINHKINELVKTKFNGNNSKFAEFMGTSEANVRNYRTKTEPKLEFITKLAQKLEISYEYFLGEDRGKQEKGIPLIPIEAIAGFPASDSEGVFLEDCERYHIPEFERIGAKFLIRVSGSSMYPKYSNGDLLACTKLEDILFFQWGKVYVIDSSQGALVKRIFRSENPDSITLVSDNKEKYPPFDIPKSDIRSLSIVLGVVRLE
ncbi:MAG: S24 family peptidase [Prevotellaceae bacterium]|jgi:transcriptional regulator with XRE-family HTH domain|nr:S24 family peptidase [Prevotellaceae bacterium]